MRKITTIKKYAIRSILFFIVLFGVFIMIQYLTKTSVNSPGLVTNDQLQLDEPDLQASVIVSSLDKPWGIDFFGDESFIFTTRAGSINLYNGREVLVLLKPNDLDARGEAGLMGVAIDPEFETNKFVYVCYATKDDVRVNRWTLNGDENSLDNQNTIVDSIPVNSSGRHSGCRVSFGPDNNMWIATGDAANEKNPQAPGSLGGKILRVDRNGGAVEGNLKQPFDTRIFSYGHRNSQGIAFINEADQQKYGFIGYSTEHGPDKDDEINKLVPGNFGWDPGEGYDESVPMTDIAKYNDAIGAGWSSGASTKAVAGATFIYGDDWKAMNGKLLVATLKAKQVLQFRVNANGGLTEEAEIFKNDKFGRIRSIQQAPNGALYLLTDNGGGEDKIIKFTPADPTSSPQ